MDYSLSQELKLQQTLSPQMLQSLALLPMPIQDFQAYIRDKIEENPALEIPETDLVQNYNDDRLLTWNADDEASDRKQSFLENIADDYETLQNHLLLQLGQSNADNTTAEIAEYLIGNLDENGFHIVSLDKLFEGKNYTNTQINKAVELVQSFDPCGICTSDYRQSLVLQAEKSGMAKEDIAVFSEIVNNHLEDVNNLKYREISRKLRISQEDLETFISILRTFTPYPGRNYTKNPQHWIIPEFSIHDVDGDLVLKINNANMPELKISPEFEALSDKTDEKEANRYIKASVKQAQDLIMQVQMRYKTLSKTALALMEYQRDFFFDGPKALKTLSLKDVARKVEVHETTISRLTQNKYVETDYGIFPLKYFFTQGVETSSGENISRNAVKEMIAEMKNNNKKLSAQKISDILAEKGINCARRTVAKYISEL